MFPFARIDLNADFFPFACFKIKFDFILLHLDHLYLFLSISLRKSVAIEILRMSVAIEILRMSVAIDSFLPFLPFIPFIPFLLYPFLLFLYIPQ